MFFVSPARPKSVSPDRRRFGAAAVFESPTASKLAASPLRNDRSAATDALSPTAHHSTASRRVAATASVVKKGDTTPRANGRTATSPQRNGSAGKLATESRHTTATLQPSSNLPSTTVVDDLLSQLVVLRKDLHAAREGYAAEAHRNDTLALEVRTVTNELTAARTDAQRFERQARALGETTQKLEHQLSELSKEHRNAVAAWRSEETVRKEVEQSLVDVRNALDRVTRERNTACVDLEAAQRKLAQSSYDAADELRTSRRDRDAQAFAADELRSQLYTVEQTQRAQFELYKRKAEGEIVTLQGRVDELQSIVMQLEDRNSELEEALTAEKALRTTAEEEKETAKRQYTDAEAACQEARRAVEADATSAVAAAENREAESEANLHRALVKADEISKLCEGLMAQVAEREAEICRLEDVNHVLAVRLKAAVADAEARAMEGEARVMLTRQNEEMERQLRDLRRVVSNLMGKRGGGSAPGLHGTTP